MLDKKSFISIIIPVYNRVDVFKRSLETAVKQTYRPFEIIVVDDGSTEGDVERVLRDVRGDIKIIYYKQKNQGAPVARNKGFEMSQGDYVIFWDADVIADVDMLENMLTALQKSDADFSYSNFKLGQVVMKGKLWGLTELKKLNFITSTTLMRRDAFPGFDTTLKKFQDWDLFLTMGEQGKKGIWVDKTLFRIIGGGTMSTWLPSCMYKKPWKWLPVVRERVRMYEEARYVIKEKHRL